MLSFKSGKNALNQRFARRCVRPSGCHCEHPESLLPWRSDDAAYLFILVDHLP